MRLYNGVELHLLSRLEKEAHANGISHPFLFSSFKLRYLRPNQRSEILQGIDGNG